MNEIVKVFNDRPVRIVEENRIPWFVGKDVCAQLGYRNETDAMNRHCKGVVKRYPLQTAGGQQEIRVISEADVMRLICGSKLPEAVRFERWVFEEILPSIRKHGAYIAPGISDAHLADVISGALSEHFKRTAQENADLKAWMGYYQSFAPNDAVGELSKTNGIPRLQWRSGCWVSRFGRPYTELMENMKRLQLASEFTPMLPGFEQPLPALP